MDWFKHDIYCLQDDRLFTLVSRYGADGYAVFFHTVEAMYANDGEPIYEMALRRIAFELSLSFDKVQSIIDFAASESCGNLFETTDNSGYISLRVIKGVEENESKRQRYSNMGKASAERRNNISSNVGSTQVERELNAGSTDKIRRDKKRKDITSLSKDSLVGGQQADTPAKNEEGTDLFGQKIELKPESEKIPYEEIGQYWNEKAKGKLPVLREINDKRKALIKQRWTEYGKDVFVAIDKIVASDSMVAWGKCGFDWCFQKSNMIKILEGNYDNNRYSGGRSNNRSFRPTDINGQYDDLPPAEVIEV